MKEGKVELLGYLSIVQDPRLDRKKLHLLSDILFLSVCAGLCGCDTWEDIYDFGIVAEAWLKQYIDLSNGIPSADTIARVFSLLNPKEFETAFRNWVLSLYRVEEGKIIAIDGKCVKGSRGSGNAAIHMVGAFATEAGLALAQVKTEDKSNEITAIPELLDGLILKGCIVTLDAMGCQKNIVKKIIDQCGDYVISLKGNQGALHEDVSLFLRTEKERGFEKVAHDFYETIEKGHGRVETRRYWITSNIDWLDQKSSWPGLQSIGLVESIRDVKGEVSCELRCFIASIKGDAKRFAEAVRQHWAIENNLHWQLDITFNEDKLKARMGYAAQNLSVMRRMILNVLKLDTTSKGSLQGKRKKAGWSREYLQHLLTLLFNF